MTRNHFIVFLCFLFCAFVTSAQNKEVSDQNPKSSFIKEQAYLAQNTLNDFGGFSGDSLNGFNEQQIKTELLAKGIYGSEFLGHIHHLKREFINHKYNLGKNALLNSSTTVASNTNNSKTIGGSNVINLAPCVNEGFESTPVGVYTTSNAIVGWTVTNRSSDSNCNPTNWAAGSSEFSVVSTPISGFPGAGIIPHSPLGGNVVVQLNNATANYAITKIAQAFPVTSANSLFRFAFAGYWQDGGSGHACCDQPSFKVLVRDCSNNLLSCPSLSLNANTLCGNPTPNYTVVTNVASWTNWQLRTIDLTPYIGTCVIIEAISMDCAFGGHYGTTLFDAQCGSQNAPFWNSSTTVSTGGPVSFCPGSNVATIQAPLGYTTYSWIPPATHPTLSASQASQSALTTSNALPGSIFTVNLINTNGCIYTHTIPLVYSSVEIVGIASAPTCSLGSSGSASVMAYGSSSGYNYTWVNSTNSVVGTSSIVSNLAPGLYSVTVTASGTLSCGSSSTTASVSLSPPNITNLTKPYCGSSAFFSAPTAGSNFQWYNSSTAIPAFAGGTASSYTLTPVALTSFLWLSYITYQGCKDSIKYTLSPITPGWFSSAPIPTLCSGATNGSITYTLIPAVTATGTNNAFSFISIGATPAYSLSVSSSSAINFPVSNLSAGGTYSVSAFDGICPYTATLSIPVHPALNFFTTPLGSPTLCIGDSVTRFITLPGGSPPHLYSFSWSPTTFLSSGNGTVQQTVITPSTAPGTSATIVYTIAVTTTLQGCTDTRTLAVSVTNPLPPVISPIPLLCTNSPSYAVSVSPTGGSFSGASGMNSSGIITPALASVGTNTLIYSVLVGSCTAKTNSSFIVNQPPVISISGNTAICEGQSTTLLANGANAYNWLNVSTGPIINVTPTVSTNYIVQGTNINTNCSNTATINVSVFPNPVLSIFGDTLLCAGESVTLTASGANSYNWSNGSPFNAIIVSPGNDTTYMVTGTNNQTSCSASKTVFVKVLACTGAGELLMDGGSLSAYPNPVSDFLILETPVEVSLTIVDELGKLLLDRKIVSGKHNIDLRNLAAGVYLVTLRNGKEIKTLKLVKTD